MPRVGVTLEPMHDDGDGEGGNDTRARSVDRRTRDADRRAGRGSQHPPRADRAEREAAESAVLWGVGAVSQRLGIATPTLRTWDRRYGLGPSARTEGGHRRYSELDVARVARMSQLIGEGVPPSQAAQVVQQSVHDPAAVLASPTPPPPDGSAVTGPGVAMTVNAMIRAARTLDADTLARMLTRTFDQRGLVAGWTEVVAPLLIAVGDARARGDLGIESEHLASECVQTEVRHRVRQSRARRPVAAPVLLASAADEQHSLPIHVLAAALTERRIDTLVLGERTPTVALAAAIDLAAPRVVFLWSSMTVTGHVPRLATTGSGPPPILLLGGPGWDQEQGQPQPQLQVERVQDLSTAVDCITAMVS
jgi:MerR family transcriptional regulator, light-induced transcriptional regulator